jgi:hypothetical protein
MMVDGGSRGDLAMICIMADCNNDLDRWNYF